MDILSNILPMVMVAIPFIVPISELVSGPDFNYPALADMSFFMRLYNMAVFGYIFTSSVLSLIKASKSKVTLYPVTFALFWLEQYSLTITYFDNSIVTFIGSLIARFTRLTLFVYVVYNVTSKQRRRKMEIEAREKTLSSTLLMLYFVLSKRTQLLTKLQDQLAYNTILGYPMTR